MWYNNRMAVIRIRTLRVIAILALLALLAAGCAAPAVPNTDTLDFAAPTDAAPGYFALTGTPEPEPAAATPREQIPYDELLITPSPTPQEPTQSPVPTQEPTPAPETTPASPSPKATPNATPTAAPTAVPPVSGQPLSGYVIGIDPGHQAHANRDKEPVAPGSSTMKNKVSSGTYGRFSGVREYEVNLAIGIGLRDALQKLGATVVMTRDSNDVDISNVERAQFFNKHNTDYALRLHCNGSDNADKAGAFMLVPKSNPYKADCDRAAKLLIDAYCGATGFQNLGVTVRSDQTGFNWCERMVVNIEMGHMTNEKDDHMLTDSAVQKNMVQGLVNGITAYFQ